jgi:hypothetical protein
MVDPITERATCNFTIKVYPSGQLYIAYDPIDSRLAIASTRVFGFDLSEGITAEQATEIAKFLNNHLICMNMYDLYTSLRPRAPRQETCGTPQRACPGERRFAP